MAEKKKDSNIRRKNKFHWKLRAFHLNDDSFRAAKEHQHVPEKTASAIFASSSSSIDNDDINANCKTAVVDGKQVDFELRENVTQPPTTDRQGRLQRTVVNINADPSHWDVRARFWLIKLRLTQMTVLYLVLFLVINVIFAGLFYIQPDKCCDDPDMTFAEVFDFTVQTSTTIGYGGYVPHGYFANFLVVMLSYLVALLNAVLAGLIFLKFVTPIARLQFSNTMVYCNFNGLPCLQVRVGNSDGQFNNLTDMTARMTCMHLIQYKDERGREQTFGQTEELKLLSDKRDQLAGVWTLKHVVDETSPLFGLNFSEFPGDTIKDFRVAINAMQDITMAPINAQTSYMIEDVLIGHAFEDQIDWDQDAGIVTIDYAKLSATYPSPVWYPKPSRL